MNGPGVVLPFLVPPLPEARRVVDAWRQHLRAVAIDLGMALSMSGMLDRRIHDIFGAERQQLLDDLASAEERLDAKESEKVRIERRLQSKNARLTAELTQL